MLTKERGGEGTTKKHFVIARAALRDFAFSGQTSDALREEEYAVPSIIHEGDVRR